jgi:hypothetical protein
MKILILSGIMLLVGIIGITHLGTSIFFWIGILSVPVGIIGLVNCGVQKLKMKKSIRRATTGKAPR